MDNLCRVCLKSLNGIELFNVDYELEAKRTILETLIAFANIEVENEDRMPKYICKNCKEKFADFIDFQNTIVSSDKYWKGINASSIEKPEIKLELIKAEESCVIEHSVDLNNVTVKIEPECNNIDELFLETESVDIKEELEGENEALFNNEEPSCSDKCRLFGYKKCSVFGCEDTVSPRHNFPNPERFKETFKLWLEACKNSRLFDLDPETIFKWKKKVCDKHFQEADKYRCGRLKFNTVPKLCLPFDNNIDVETVNSVPKPNQDSASGSEIPASEIVPLKTTHIKIPTTFNYKVKYIIDKDNIVLWAALKTVIDCDNWIKEFEALNSTKWIVRSSAPNVKRLAGWKKYMCHHSSYNKSLKTTKKSKNYHCEAKITIVIKLSTKNTMQMYPEVREGMPAIITINNRHNHSIHTADALSSLPASFETRKLFENYFENGLGITESIKYHISRLELETDKPELAKGSLNPKYRTVRYWYDTWRNVKLGPGCGRRKRKKLQEKPEIV